MQTARTALPISVEIKADLRFYSELDLQSLKRREDEELSMIEKFCDKMFMLGSEGGHYCSKKTDDICGDVCGQVFYFLFLSKRFFFFFFISFDPIDLFVQTPIDDFLLSFRSTSFFPFWIYLISNFYVLCAPVWLLGKCGENK